MRTPAKLAAFGGATALAFTAALGVGTAVGDPLADSGAHGSAHGAVGDGQSAGHGDSQGARHGNGHGEGAAGGHGDHSGKDKGASASAVPGGLMVSDRGYSLDLAADALAAGTAADLSYRIVGADGQPVTGYEVSHDKPMHLIAVRRDSTGFQHVHPELGSDGTWRVPLHLSAGSWRVFADFVPALGDAAGETVTLGADLNVAGDYQPVALPAPSRTAQVDDYTVTLDGELAPGKESALTLSVSRDGQPVTDLQPYLAAYGHLVALRAGDLAYLHVHPAGEPGDGKTAAGPDITFYATAPSPGAYRLFLDFQHNGVVRTAEFTVRAGAQGSAGTTVPAAPETFDSTDDGHSDDGHSH